MKLSDQQLNALCALIVGDVLEHTSRGWRWQKAGKVSANKERGNGNTFFALAQRGLIDAPNRSLSLSQRGATQYTITALGRAAVERMAQ